MSEVLTNRVYDLGARFRIHNWSLIVSVQCLQCAAKPILRIVDGADTACPSCGATYSIGGMKWEITNPQGAQLAVAASAPRLSETMNSPLLPQ